MKVDPVEFGAPLNESASVPEFHSILKAKAFSGQSDEEEDLMHELKDIEGI